MIEYYLTFLICIYRSNLIRFFSQGSRRFKSCYNLSGEECLVKAVRSAAVDNKRLLPVVQPYRYSIKSLVWLWLAVAFTCETCEEWDLQNKVNEAVLSRSHTLIYIQTPVSAALHNNKKNTLHIAHWSYCWICNTCTSW